MAEREAKFLESDAIRIAEVVRAVEHESIGEGASGQKRRPVKSSHGFWAQITAQEDGGYKYSWKKLEWKDTGKLEANSNYPTGSHEQNKMYAVEAKWRSKYVVKDSIVWLYPSVQQTFFWFDYEPGICIAKIVSAETVSARSGITPGSGNVTFLKIDDDEEFVDGEMMKVFNPFSSEIKGEEGETSSLYLEVEFGLGGLWWVSGVECQTDDSSEET